MNETTAFTLACRDGHSQPPVLRDVSAAARLDGTLFELVLRQTYRNTGTQLLDNQTLLGAGVKVGDELRLQPEITAGHQPRQGTLVAEHRFHHQGYTRIHRREEEGRAA